MQLKKILFGLLAIFIITSCVVSCVNDPKINDVKMPDIGIKNEEFNTKFSLVAPKAWNSFKIGDDIGLELKVTSNDQIAFNYDFGARLFFFEDNQWIEVENNGIYQQGYIVLGQNDGAIAGLDPNLPESTNPITLRIILLGNIYQDEQVTKKQVATYIDLKLDP